MSKNQNSPGAVCADRSLLRGDCSHAGPEPGTRVWLPRQPGRHRGPRHRGQGGDLNYLYNRVFQYWHMSDLDFWLNSTPF